MSNNAVPWVEGLTIGRMLRETARRFPGHDALVFPGLDPQGLPGTPANAGDAGRYCLSYRQLDDEVDRVARALMAIGIEKGENVAVWSTNWPQWVLLQFATARIGAVQVTINPAYRTSELAYVLKQSDAAALFLIDRFRTSDYFAMTAEAVGWLGSERSLRSDAPRPTALKDQGANAPRSPVGALQSAVAPRLRHVISMNSASAPGIVDWESFLAKAGDVAPAELEHREASLAAGDPINIQYTSGTTGFPKGATLTHRNLLLNGYYIGDCQHITEDDRICIPVPFYHCFGCVLGTLCGVIRGAALVIPAEHFNAEATLDAIERERATAVYGVPTMFIAELEHPTFKSRELSSLRTGIMAGSPCPIEIMNRVVDEMGAKEVTIAYGLTEASPVITMTRTDDPLELRVKTVGRPIPGIEVKVIDPASGNTLGDNEQGELCTRGHVVMLGYYNMPERTAETIDADGWLHSGDLALRLPNGYYRITGRIKEMICRGGENIYPREVEEFLYTHPAVENVAVVGIPDVKFVEEVAAWIKLKEGAAVGEEELRQFCRDKLAHYKIPKHIRFVREFPQTVTGKIQKFKIREAMIEELGLNEAETA